MQKKPELKPMLLLPPKETQESTSVFGKNLEDRVVKSEDSDPSSSSFNIEKTPSEEENIETLKKRKFQAITGEEDESTAFQGDFKLFVWSLESSNWAEKGMGQLKLNDSTDKKRSRLIMRVYGTLKIILNVAILPTFRIIVSTKNTIRFTDGQTVWAASGSYASQLNKLIEERVRMIKEEDKESNNTPPKKAKIYLEPDHTLDLKPEPKSDFEPVPKTDSEPNPQSDAEPVSKTESEADSQSDTEPVTKSDSAPDDKSDSESGPNSDPQPDSEGDSLCKPCPVLDSNSECNSSPKKNLKIESKQDLDTDLKSDV